MPGQPRQPRQWFIVSARWDRQSLSLYVHQEREGKLSKRVGINLSNGVFSSSQPKFCCLQSSLDQRAPTATDCCHTREKGQWRERVGLIGVDNWIPLKSFRVKRLSTKAATIFGSASKLKRFPSSASTSKHKCQQKWLKPSFTDTAKRSGSMAVRAQVGPLRIPEFLQYGRLRSTEQCISTGGQILS